MPFPRRLSATAALAAGLIAATMQANAATGNGEFNTFAGNYLAGRSADLVSDIDAAVTFYGNALDVDPDNPGLAERLLLLSLANGDIERGFELSEELAALDSTNPIAALALAVRAVKQGNLDTVEEDLSRVAPAPLATLSAGLITAWAAFGQGELEHALATIDALEGPNWYDIFKAYISALMLDAAGRTADAIEAISKAYETDTAALKIVDGYARILARAGRTDEAIKALTDFGGEAPLHPIIKALKTQIESGEMPPPTAGTAKEGVAETLYGLGTAIGTEEGPELSAAYLQLSTYLDAESHLATMALGDLFQEAERCDEAIAFYDSVPESAPLRRNADIQIGRCLDTLGRPDDAIQSIAKVVDANPSDFEAAVELGNVFRGDSRFAEAAEAYSRGIAALDDPAAAGWTIFYFRGVAYERSKRWDDAEADFRQALELSPKQPHVLNYLGYSWVDMGLHLEEALDMIKTAVELRPNDGYIVDSLGWAYYRLARYDEAVTELERAIELKPEDPTINDHLGDAYWRVGRKREALFQWTHARDLDPDADQLPKILTKLEHGLDGQPEATNEEEPAEEAGASDEAGVEISAVNPESEAGPTSVMVEPGDSLWSIADRVYGSATLYLRIYEANRDRISNPDLIFPGTTLNVPAATEN